METSFNTFTGNFFTFKNQKCDCKISISYDTNGNTVTSFNLAALPNKHFNYAYYEDHGLIMVSTESNEILKQIHPIEDLLQLNPENAEEVKDYFLTYGFFLPLEDSYYSYRFNDIQNVIQHFKMTVELISLLEEKNKDYSQLLKKILLLNFYQSAAVYPYDHPKSELYARLNSCHHHFQDSWVMRNSSLLTNINSSQKYYTVNDSFTNNKERVSREDYAKLIAPRYHNRDKGLSISASDSINFLYFTNQTNQLSRNIIDLLYHINKEICRIKDINTNIGITFTNEIILNQVSDFTQKYKNFIVKIGKETIKEEIDFAIQGIHPVYNINTMEPDWKISNLYSAIYFSIFYTRPNYAIYRKCKNEFCNAYFRVPCTNSKKIYHDKCCQVKAANQRYYKKKKQQ